MSQFMYMLLETSAIASMSALLVIVVRKISYKRIGKGYLYLLWILVFLKFLLPIDLISLDLSDFSTSQESDIALNVPELKIENQNNLNSEEEFLQNDFVKAMTKKNTVYYKVPGTMTTYLFWFWLLVFIGIQIWILSSFFHGKKTMKLERMKDKSILIHSQEELYTGEVSVPMILGIFRPIIVLPKNTEHYDEETLKYILIHELEHKRFHDGLINYLTLTVASIHWFNPLIWLCHYLLREDIEGFCDERVLKLLKNDGRKQYAKALLNCSVNVSKNQVFALSFSEGNLKKRIKGIMKYKQVRVSSIIIGVLLILLLGGTALLNFNQSINISDRESREGYVDALSRRELLKIIEANGIELNKSNEINANDYALGNIEPEVYELVDDYSYMLVYVFDTLDERKALDIDGFWHFNIEPNYADITTVVRNAVIVQLLKWPDMSTGKTNENYDKSIEINRVLDDLIFYQVHNGEEYVYVGESAHWQGTYGIRTYQYFWTDSNEQIQYERYTRTTSDIHYTGEDIENVKNISYDFSDNIYGGSGIADSLNRDGTLQTGSSGGNSYYYKQFETIQLSLEWYDLDEVLEMDLVEE